MAGRLLNQRYQILGPLGSGSGGSVFRVRDTGAEGQPERALKLVRDRNAGHDLAAEFERLSRLEHRALVAVHDLGRVETALPGFAEGTTFFTADLARGDDLCAAIATASDPVALLIASAEDIASALHHIHRAGFVHCDVKPANIVVAGGEAPGATLLDLGLAVSVGRRGAARGSPAYMSREAFAGAPEPRSDLYALGAALFHAAAGAPPIAGDSAAEVARQILEGVSAPPVAERAPWVPPALAQVVDRLLAPTAAARPSSAAVVLDHLAQARDALGMPAHAIAIGASPAIAVSPPLVGRDDETRALVAALGDPEVGLIRLIGVPGVGRAALLERARQAIQLAAIAGAGPAVDVVAGAPDHVMARLVARFGDPGPAPASTDAFVDRLLELGRRAAAERRVVLALEAEPDDDRAHAVARAAAAHAAVRASQLAVLIRIDGERALPVEGAVDLALAPLDLEQVGELVAGLLGRPAPRDRVEAITEASGGVPGLVIELVRSAAGDLDAAGSDRLTDAAAFARWVVRRAAASDDNERQVVEALAVLGGRGTVAAVAATLETDAEAVHRALPGLTRSGLAHVAAGVVSLPRLHLDPLYDAIPASRRRALHRRALAWHEDAGADAAALARHLVVTGPAARAVAVCRDAARDLRGRGATRAARAMLEAAAGAGPGTKELDVERAVLATELGDYDAAIATASAAARSRKPSTRRRAELALARAQQKAGQLEDAEATLRRLAERVPDDPEVAGALARLLCSRGRFADAAALAGEPASTGALAAGDAARLEAAGLAALYQGDHTGADRWFRVLERRAQASGDDAIVSRSLGLAGMAAQTGGDIAGAATLYERAASLARAQSMVHEAAVYELNRASALAESGRHGAALEALDQALAALNRLGDVPELGAALFNRGIELLVVGELEAARRAADRAAAIAEHHGTPRVAIYASLLRGDVARRGGDHAAAAACYRQAHDHASAAGSGRDALLALANLAEVLAEAGDAGAREAVERAAALARSADDRDRLTVCRGRVALALGDRGDDVAELDDTRRRFRASGRLEQAWRADVIAARLARAAGDDERAASRADEARDLFDQLMAQLPEARRSGFALDPDAVVLASLARQLGAEEQPPSAATHADDREVRRLLALSRRLNSEVRLAPLLDQVIDTAIELTSAERGFLLLFDTAGDHLDIHVARHFGGGGGAIVGDELAVSRSIAERAARTGEVVLTVDAAFDERFGAAESVAAMRLRSVLAVPLRQKNRVSGTIYLDHRFRSGAFDDQAIELARELADIAAVAIENARLLEENQRRAAEIAALNQRLSDQVVEVETELATVRARLATGDRDGLRNRYDAIVGESPAVVEMLSLVDRAADTGLPVVIVGESGTGKELVARALHDNGSRRGAPFVALNCGAVPESLLESELFGHVRGAFTGADRDHRGLFEVADGGTLLLDEVADTSLAMQAKLLRVLQESEIRRVGDSHTRKVDVRVVAATNRPLDELVAAGTFREDLYYRLSVLCVRVPPLRERIEDLPSLAGHILRRLTADPPALSRAAMARLVAYPWPGNIRELENELARACAMADGTIGDRDLSPRVRDHAGSAPRAGAPGSNDLRLKPRVEALERALVDQAMSRTGGNQTAAARELGLSRYGLQKKLKRYGIG